MLARGLLDKHCAPVEAALIERTASKKQRRTWAEDVANVNE